MRQANRLTRPRRAFISDLRTTSQIPELIREGVGGRRSNNLPDLTSATRGPSAKPNHCIQGNLIVTGSQLFTVVSRVGFACASVCKRLLVTLDGRTHCYRSRTRSTSPLLVSSGNKRGA